MDAQTGSETQVKKGERGRKDAEKQEAVIKMKEVKDRIEDLVKLYNAAGDANDKLNDAIKATAEKAGLLSSVVRKFVVARAGENFEEAKRNVEQLSLCFDEVGLLGGSK
ncbi:MAG: hypothetical protein M0Z99_32185 [Betaproteobacteria bacterium]|nr:hypothetical protein [Betaproteobacteria bacterium]